MEYAKKHSLSSELAGRELRYAFFEELKKEKGIDKIATAHNKNDSAESILLHLIRGCGIDGMGGISPMRNGYIIRPIIEITKKEIQQYCADNSLEYVVDKTNFETDYTRNKIRLLLLPIIEKEINPNFISTVTENADIFSEAAEFLDGYSEKVYNRVCKNNSLCIGELMNEDIAVVRCVIQKLFCKYRKSCEKLSVKHINEIIAILKSGQTSKTLNLPMGISARIEYGGLFFTATEKNPPGFDYVLKPGEEIYVLQGGFSVIIKDEEKAEKDSKNKIYFYTEKEDCEFRIRSRKNADMFMPVGMSGRKKLSDLFSDMKIPKDMRDNIPLLICDKEIVWVACIRRDRRFLKGKRLMSCEIIKRSMD